LLSYSLNTQKLARYLAAKTNNIDFIEPKPELQRTDSQEICKRILQLTQQQAKQLMIGKGTLHYLRKHAKNDKSIKTYKEVTQIL
jgi:CRISP-associated protein Cas1